MSLFPPIAPFNEGLLPVSARHALHFEESGHPSGVPAVVLHGGPGGGSQPYYRQFFDPRRYRVVLFDQRGCGLSTPFADVTDNDTPALVADIERLRQHLGIDRWVIFGGSWGATLALAYAERHPERVLGLVLRGVFLGRPSELDWLYRSGGAERLFPERFREFAHHVPEAERGDLLNAYHRRLFGTDPQLMRAAAQAWARWETSISRLVPDAAAVDAFCSSEAALAIARLENHFFVNDLFFDHPDQLLREAPRLAGLPMVIVQGRYDAVCPPISAWQLAQAVPGSVLEMVPDAGHTLGEPGIARALVAATNRFARQLGAG
jgi:proline iminopeptidase